MNLAVSTATEAREYDKARKALERARALFAFRDKVSALGRQWDQLARAAQSGRRARGGKGGRPPKVTGSRMVRGGITPESTYRPLILGILSKHGGAAETSVIRAELKKELKGRFTAKDRRSHHGECPVWWNRAMWERFKMVKAGLLRSGSPRGVWEISQTGRSALA